MAAKMAVPTSEELLFESLINNYNAASCSRATPSHRNTDLSCMRGFPALRQSHVTWHGAYPLPNRISPAQQAAPAVRWACSTVEVRIMQAPTKQSMQDPHAQGGWYSKNTTTSSERRKVDGEARWKPEVVIVTTALEGVKDPRSLGHTSVLRAALGRQ